jgi:hypothetical protein
MKTILIFPILFVLLTSHLLAQNTGTMNNKENFRLAVLWTSGDPEVAEKACFMYTLNAKKQAWFYDVVLIVWGPSSKLMSENVSLQEYVKKMQNAGVRVEACQACAEMYGIADKLREMKIDVKYMGLPLTNYLKTGWKVLTF